MYLKFYPHNDRPRLVKIDDPAQWPKVATKLIGAKMLDHTTDANGDTIFCDDVGALKALPANPHIRHMFAGYTVHGHAVVIPGTEDLTFFGADAPLKYDETKPQQTPGAGMHYLMMMLRETAAKEK